MSTATRQRPPKAAALGGYAPMLVLLLLAGLSIEEGLRLLVTADPAAQAGVAGWYVLVLGAILAVTTCYAERPSMTEGAADDEQSDGELGERAQHPATPRRDMVVCLVLIAAYAVLLGTLGHVLAGIVVVFLFLRAISRYDWLRSTVYTLGTNAVFVAVFELSGVILPRGILGF